MGTEEKEELKSWDLRLDFNFSLRRIDTRTRMRVISKLLSRRELEGLGLVCGCGVGVECKVLRDRGSNVVGLDVNRQAIKVASSNLEDIPFVVGDATKLPFREESFSQIVCSAVLEHIPDDKGALLEMERTLRKGGKLAITTPRRKHSESDVQLKEEVRMKFGHVREGYTVNDLKILMNNGRLRILRVKFYWGPLHWLMLKLFEMTPHTVRKASAEELDSRNTKSFDKLIRTRMLNSTIFLLTLISYIDDFLPIHSSLRSGLGMLMEKI